MESKIRVVFLSPVSDFRGGAERSLMDLMANPSIEPLLVTPDAGALSKAAEEKGYSCDHISFGTIATLRRPVSFNAGLSTILDLFRCSRATARKCRAFNADILHTNGLKAHVVGIFARLFLGPKVVPHFRDIPHTALERLTWRIITLLSSHSIAVSRPCWPGKGLPKKLTVIRNAIKVPPDLVTRTAQSPLRIGFVGRVHRHKGLSELIDWCRYARYSGLACQIIVVGEAQPEDRDYINRIKSDLIDHRDENLVEWVGWLNDGADIYIRFDILAVPSQTPDPLPRTVMEGQAHGVPVIATPVGGIPDLINPGKTGFFAVNAEEFHAVLSQLVNAKIRQQIVAAGYHFVKENLTHEKLYRSVDTVYRKLI